MGFICIASPIKYNGNHYKNVYYKLVNHRLTANSKLYVPEHMNCIYFIYISISFICCLENRKKRRELVTLRCKKILSMW